MEFILKLAAKYLAKINFKEIDKIVSWVIEVSEKNKEGWEKAEEVINQFDNEWADRASWVVRTVVQIAYAIAKIRGLEK